MRGKMMLALLLIPLSIIPVPSKRGARRGNDTCAAKLQSYWAIMMAHCQGQSNIQSVNVLSKTSQTECAYMLQNL